MAHKIGPLRTDTLPKHHRRLLPCTSHREQATACSIYTHYWQLYIYFHPDLLASWLDIGSRCLSLSLSLYICIYLHTHIYTLTPMLYNTNTNTDIFERAVQDPCSEACDSEDSSPYNQFQSFLANSKQRTLYTLPHKPLFKDMFNDEDEEEEEDEHEDEGLSMDKHRLRKTNTIPFNTTAQRPKLRNRANSCALIHQLYRSNSATAESPLLARTYSNSSRMNSVLCNNYNYNYNYSTAQDFSSLRKQSSSLAIPTHVYGLEKYVSSQLDELSSSCVNTATHSSHTPSTTISSSSRSSTDTLSSISSADSDTINKHHPPINNNNRPTVKQASKSFIKVSLANSFA